MDPITMSIIGGLGGNIISGIGGALGQSSANATNIALQGGAQQFAQYMSNTAHQREVKDLEAAGLNPILAAGGGGASTPTVAPAHVDAVNPLAGVGPGIQAAMQGATAVSQMDLNDANAALSDAQRVTEGTKQAVNLASAPNIDADTRKKNEETASMIFRNFWGPTTAAAEARSAVSAAQRSRQQEPAEESEAEARKASADWRKQHPVLDEAIDRVMQMMGVWSTARGASR